MSKSGTEESRLQEFVIKPVEIGDLALPRELTLPNGVRLYDLGGNGKGVVRFDILFKGGYGVQSKALQALFTNRMLREGAAGYSGDDISKMLDYYGAWTDIYSSQGCNHLTLYTMSKHFLPLVALLEKMIKNPTFPQENLDVLKRNNKSYYMVNSRKVDVVSQRYFENSLWGDGHPLAHIVVPEDYDAITRDDLVEYYNRVYNSKNCTLFLTGDTDAAMLEAVARSFGDGEWGTGVPVGDIAVPAAATLYGRRNITVDGALQSAVKIGFLTVDSSHPDFYKLRFLTVLLGGYFGSRLMSNVREENGLTYHIEAEIDAYGRHNVFMVSSETDNGNVERLVKEIYAEIERLVCEPVSEEEVEHVRRYIQGELCREYEGRFAKSEVFINAWLSGEEFESVNAYLETVRNVSASELSEVARAHFKRDAMIEIVVGA